MAVIALTCMAPSMAINAVHQFTHTPGAMAYPLAGAAVLSVLLAGSSPFAMEAAFRQRRFGVFLVAAIAFGVCASYNLASAVGAASTARSDITGARKSDNTRGARLTGQLTQKETQRAGLVREWGEETPGIMDGVLTAKRSDPLWARSKQCTIPTMDDSRAFCDDYAKKTAKREAAAKVAELDREITELNAQLLATPAASAEQPADPQAANIAGALDLVGAPASAGKIGMGLNLWFALTIEVLGSLGPVVFAFVFRGRPSLAPLVAAPSVPAPETKPAPVIEGDSKILALAAPRKGERRRIQLVE